MSFSNLEQAMSRSSGVLSAPQKVRSRTQSISSDRPSTIGSGLMSPPLSVSPEAAFIAASAASQIVTNDHDSHADTWYDQHGIEPSGETAVVSPSALRLVNSFLDQLLFNFLSVSRSTALSSLRPAVIEVLKPKLAKDAINQADEELREYLGGDDDDEPAAAQDPRAARNWDLELIWKRTRLRCMVYSSLGDMEEEDEDYHMEHEHLDAGLSDRLSEVVPAAVAIFLTSILEFMGEAALVAAGQAAFHRMRAKHEKELKDGARSPTNAADRIVVDEFDMERVALDRTLGRLWRAWKKKIRSPAAVSDSGISKPHTRESGRGTNAQHMRQSSLILGNESSVPATVPEPAHEGGLEDGKNIPSEETGCEAPGEEYLLAASIPLPMTDNDIDEIEVPGLALYPDDAVDSLIAPLRTDTRPKSLIILPYAVPAALPSPTSQPHTPVVGARKRSSSLPTPALTPYSSPQKRPLVNATANKLPGDTEPTERADNAGISTEVIPQITRTNEGTPHLTEVAQFPIPPSSAKSLAPGVAGSSHKRNLSAESAVISSAAAVELTTVAGLPAGSDVEGGDTDGGEELEEVPQVLTSSRISISGRSVSPAMSEHRRPPPINPNLPARSLSVHSLRLIDVASPRTPSTRSRGSSVDATELIRSANLSRNNSASTTPVIDEYRAPLEPVPSARASTMFTHAPESISEAEELGADDGFPTLPPDVREDNSATPTAKRRSTAPYGQLDSDAKASLPIFGSAVRQSPPSSPPRQAPKASKATMIAAASSSGTFFIDEKKPEVPAKSRAQGRGYPPVQAPTVPARSPGRQAPEAAKAAASPAASIGAVSVEPRARSTSEVRQLHTSGSTTSSSNGSRLKAVRTPDESPITNNGDTARNFEELIQSDETIQYTLTPSSARDDVSGALISVRELRADSIRTAYEQQPCRPGSDPKERRREQRRSALALIVRQSTQRG